VLSHLLTKLSCQPVVQEVDTGKHTWANYFLAAYKVGWDPDVRDYPIPTMRL